MSKLNVYLKKISLQEHTYNKKVLNELFIQMSDILKLSSPEKELQMLRLAIVAETDAVNLYESMASNTKDPRLKKLFLDVAREEKVHFGEFEEVLELLDSEHEEAEEEGEEEIKDFGF